MKVINRINEIEARAGRVDLTLARLCRLASVPYITVWRWQSGSSSPTEAKAEAHLAALDRRLKLREGALRRQLRCVA